MSRSEAPDFHVSEAWRRPYTELVLRAALAFSQLNPGLPGRMVCQCVDNRVSSCSSLIAAFDAISVRLGRIVYAFLHYADLAGSWPLRRRSSRHERGLTLEVGERRRGRAAIKGAAQEVETLRTPRETVGPKLDLRG